VRPIDHQRGELTAGGLVQLHRDCAVGPVTPGLVEAKITLANVPPILASPPASNLIAFSGNVLTIPG
jgi:hypothetical protein